MSRFREVAAALALPSGCICANQLSLLVSLLLLHTWPNTTALHYLLYIDFAL